MTNSTQQSKDDYLTSKFLSPGFIVNRDIVGDISNLVIPLPSIASVLDETLPTPMYMRISDTCIYTKKDNIVTVTKFVSWLNRRNNSNNYIFHTVNMKKFSSLYETENRRTIEELDKLEHLFVPNFTALANFVENSCPLVGLSFESMVSRESILFELLELRKGLV